MLDETLPGDLAVSTTPTGDFTGGRRRSLSAMSPDSGPYPGMNGELAPSDDVLCRRVSGGDTEAFGLLFERHNRAIYNYCFRRVADWSEAEDLLSIVFLVAWQRRDSAPSDRYLPWLYGIATNVLRNRRRSEWRFRAALRRVAETEREPAERDTELRLEEARRMRELLEVVARLPRQQQEVFVLCTWMDLSYEEAAIALSVPIGTVRSRLARARDRLMELNPAFGHKEAGEQLSTEGDGHE